MEAGGFIDWNDLRRHLRRLIALGRNLQPALHDIADLGENSTRLRFRTETGPDGNKWKPSLRAILTGGSTLTKDGHLSDSVSGHATADSAVWGVNRVYAAIHQFGGQIRAKAGMLRFRLANGAFVQKASITLPARPYLGVNDEDREDILDILQGHINGPALGGI